MPAVAPSTKQPAVQGAVIALAAQGVSKRKIAKDLGIGRNTVDNILSWHSQTEPKNASRLSRIMPHAYDTVEKAVRAGNANIAVRLVELEQSQVGPAPITVHGDATFQTLTAIRGTAEQTTEAAKNPPTSDSGVSNATSFSQILASASDEQLEAELARRRAARPVLEAEIVREP